MDKNNFDRTLVNMGFSEKENNNGFFVVYTRTKDDRTIKITKDIRGRDPNPIYRFYLRCPIFKLKYSGIINSVSFGYNLVENIR